MSLIKSLTRTLANAALLPVAVVKDVVTLGGTLTDKKGGYTVERGKELVDSVVNIEKDLENLGKPAPK